MASILVIDDDVRFRQLVRIALEPAGHTVLDAGRASEAEAVLASVRPGLVIIDGLLPDADGSHWIGQRRKALGIPFIFASAFWKGSRESRQLQADVKPDGFVRKPAAAEQIALEVERVLGRPHTVWRPRGTDAQQLEAMRAEYAAGLAERLESIRVGLSQTKLRARDTVLFSETRRQVHELAGTAGSFGFHELSEIGARLEQALVAWRAAPDAEAWAVVAGEDAVLASWTARVGRVAPPRSTSARLATGPIPG